MQTYLPDTAYAESNLNSLPQVSPATAITSVTLYLKFCGQKNSSMLHRALISNYLYRQNCTRNKIIFSSTHLCWHLLWYCPLYRSAALCQKRLCHHLSSDNSVQVGSHRSLLRSPLRTLYIEKDRQFFIIKAT